MSPLVLKTGNQFAPGGFAFVDPRSGKRFNGYERGIKDQVNKIIEHRRRNPSLYPPNEGKWFDKEEVLQEIYRPLFMMRPNMFVGYDDHGKPKSDNHSAPQVAITATAEYGCVCGAKDVTPVYCPSCRGMRITGWKCTACGKTRFRK